jgi:hypothetical protein
MIKEKLILENRLFFCIVFIIILAVFPLKVTNAQNLTTIATNKHRLIFTQGTDISLFAVNQGLDRLIGRNSKDMNLDFSINYNYRKNNGDNILLNLTYGYDKDSYSFYNTESSIISNSAHLLRFDLGAKFFSKRVLTKLNFYSIISVSINFSIYRKNDIHVIGLKHYQEFKGFHFSHTDFIFGKGIELQTFENQFFNLEAGFGLPMIKYNYSNLVYSLDFYFRVGYGFKF